MIRCRRIEGCWGLFAAFVCASAMHENGVGSDVHRGTACATQPIKRIVAGHLRIDTMEATMFVGNRHDEFY